MTRDEIDDDRLRFFLERRKLIQEWVRAGSAEPAAVDSFLRTLGEDLEVLASERGASVVTRVIGTETQLGLARPEWDAPEYPKAAVAIGWNRSVRFEGATEACWIGLRVRQSGTFRPFYERMREAVAALDKHPLFKSRSASQNWLEYGYFPCTRPSYWESLSGYRADLLAVIAHAWGRYEPVIQRQIEALSDPGRSASAG